ncbi:hypothetical protein [Roseovarius faecimaris]|uniref:hypothetical protein n=1 Tax=Roseovarius faecimaris TaxID=2494550 RepID=UPI0012FE44F6|nr:hypothetical protein [Roseovarius faecimaris]
MFIILSDLRRKNWGHQKHLKSMKESLRQKHDFVKNRRRGSEDGWVLAPGGTMIQIIEL